MTDPADRTTLDIISDEIRKHRLRLADADNCVYLFRGTADQFRQELQRRGILCREKRTDETFYMFPEMKHLCECRHVLETHETPLGILVGSPSTISRFLAIPECLGERPRIVVLPRATS